MKCNIEKNNVSIRHRISEAHRKGAMILPDGTLCGMDGMVTRLNNNTIVLGTSGSNKTRSMVTPNLLSAIGSYVISDPKGNLLRKYGNHMKSYGYRVVHLNLIDPEQSDHYNPLKYLHNSDQIMKLAHQIVYSDSTKPHTGSYDPFWDRAGELLLSALIAYLVEGGDREECSISGVIRLTKYINAAQLEDNGTCEMDRIFNKHELAFRTRKRKESWAYRQWLKFRQVPPRTFNTIIITVNTLLGTLDTEGMCSLMSSDDIDLRSIGDQKTAVFVEISDTDRSKDVLANTFYSQAMNELCSYADSRADSRLPVPVRFILDDFGTTCRIEGFQNMISNIRSREISAMVILQSISQLDAGYGDSAHTIIDNCDTLLYMGGNDVDTAQYVSRRSNKPLNSILEMPVGTHWRFRRGMPPVFCETADLSCYDIREFRADNKSLT